MDSRDFAPPRVVEARLDVQSNTVALRFSEPVIGLDHIDPQQFRLSLAVAYAPEKPGDEAEAVYSDLFYYLGEEGDADHDESDLLRAVAVRAIGNDRGELVLSQALPADACEAFELGEGETGGETMGLFLHYRNERHQVEDRAGNPMEPLGADWVRTRAVQLELSGQPPVHRFDLLVEVECRGDMRGAHR